MFVFLRSDSLKCYLTKSFNKWGLVIVSAYSILGLTETPEETSEETLPTLVVTSSVKEERESKDLS